MTKEEKDTQEKQIFGMHQAHSDFVARLENTLENELQCGICSELIVFVRNIEMEALSANEQMLFCLLYYII